MTVLLDKAGSSSARRKKGSFRKAKAMVVKMKNKRQNKILEIISREAIETQEELIKRLQDEGYNVTQATISRDIKELKLIKSAHGDKYRYVQSVSGEAKKDAKYDSILMETILSVDIAGHMIVIKTYEGMAMAACAAIDAMGWRDIVGSIAGDDTIFAAVRTEEAAKLVARKLCMITTSGKEGHE